MPRFNPARGGHAPGQLRDWFIELVMDEYDYLDPPPLTLHRLCGLLWNCTDMMPSDLRSEVRSQYDNWELYPEPMTYAQGARMIRRYQRSQQTVATSPSTALNVTPQRLGLFYTF